MRPSADVRRKRARKVSARAGFTLVELMVALGVGSLAIGSIYAIGSTTTRQFYAQQQIANAQTSLRSALDQVKRDIARGGYLTTPNVNVVNFKPDQTCDAPAIALNAPPDAPLAAFSRFANDVPMVAAGAGANNAIDPTGTNRANGFTADDIVLFANYETSDAYPGITLTDPANPTTIALSQSWHAVQRDFTDWSQVVGLAQPAFDMTAFRQAFAVGRLVRIQTSGRLRHFALVTGVTAPVGGVSDPTITFNPAVPANCVAAVAEGTVAPVSKIRYHVLNATGAEAQRFANTTGDVGQLVREEVQPDAYPNLLAGTVPRVILDYVVSFNLSFAMTAETVSGAADNYAPGVYINTPGTVNGSPQRIRAVQIDLAVRTPEQDATLTWTQAGCAGMACFQVFPTTGALGRRGAARVRRMRTEVFVPNVAYEGY
jgi:prepilin-type N-terminal cleavage/methylation domain-containing protein